MSSNRLQGVHIRIDLIYLVLVLRSQLKALIGCDAHIVIFHLHVCYIFVSYVCIYIDLTHSCTCVYGLV